MTIPSSAEHPPRAVCDPTRSSIWRAFGRVAPAVWILALALPGCAGGTQTAAETDPQVLTARIAELDRAIADDHASLERIVSVPRSETDPPLYDDRALRAIGERLSDQVEERDRLRTILRRVEPRQSNPRAADSGGTDSGPSDGTP